MNESVSNKLKEKLNNILKADNFTDAEIEEVATQIMNVKNMQRFDVADLNLPKPTRFGKALLNAVQDYFAKVIELVKMKVDNAKKMLQEKVFTLENLKQLITWFQIIFKNLIDMFYYIVPIVWELFKQIVMAFKDFLLVSSIKFLNLGKYVIISLFNGVEYILTLAVSDYAKNSYL